MLTKTYRKFFVRDWGYMTDTFTTRCKLITDGIKSDLCRTLLEELHADMLRHITEVTKERDELLAYIANHPKGE